jgi:uncharacterized protein
MNHPCLRCGACCASYLVAMYWSEAEALGIDPDLTEKLDPMRVSMRMDPADRGRCIALAGTVGTAAHCRIYQQRPGPCREVEASWEHGRVSDQCDRARTRHGLPVLTPADWVPALALALALPAHAPAPQAEGPAETLILRPEGHCQPINPAPL